MAVVSRFDVFLINLDSDASGDARNTRPGVVISPDEANRNLSTVIIAPLSATKTPYPTRVAVDFLNSKRFIVLDQIRAVDRTRLVKRIGEIEPPFRQQTLERLKELFAE